MVRSAGLEPATPCLEVAPSSLILLKLNDLRSAKSRKSAQNYRNTAPQAHPKILQDLLKKLGLFDFNLTHKRSLTTIVLLVYWVSDYSTTRLNQWQR